MKFKDRRLPKATPEEARRVWEAHQQPSARTVARALTLGGRPTHFTTVARWKARNWAPVQSGHPLEIARRQLEAVAALATGDSQTTINDLVNDSAHNAFREFRDGEILRRAAREVAIATTIVAKAIRNQAPGFDVAEATSALLSIAACLAALPGAFDQAITLCAADQRNNGLRSKP